MRRHALLAALATAALARPLPGLATCDCFTPEMRLRTAQEALQKARVAVYGRVVGFDGAGAAQVLVLESFKGPARDTTTPVTAPPACKPTTALGVGDETLLLAFDAPATLCDLHAREHYLLDSFRQLAAQPK